MRFNPDEYITVSERIEKFYAKFPQGRIITTIIEHSAETGFILMRAEVYREPDDALPSATGHAYELKSAGHVQAGSYVEVCETSSVGRALALLGFEVRRGVASREEVIRGAKKQQAAAAAPAPARPERPAQAAERPAQEPERAPTPPAAPADAGADLDSLILQAAEELGYDAAKVRKWVNQKYEVTGGLGSLTPHDKREVLKIFTEQARTPPPRAGR
jgi:pyruvate/2-oxoglutarate dehydrogenase complex dihydrolipoamide acyltransferase (E2) component